MAEFLDIKHAKFTYIFIPARIEDAVEVREFGGGSEKQFQDTLKAHFSQTSLSQPQKEELKANLAKNSKATGPTNKFDFDAISETVQSNYQIIPLSVPTKSNGHTCVNAYIDNVGRLKGEPLNVRASRVTSDDIRGDCFLVKSFDDENDFRRISLSSSDYEDLLANPPPKQGRWDPQQALLNMQGKGEDVLKSANKPPEIDKCSNCFKERKDVEGGKLLRCGRCRKAAYCCADCQKKDWAYHKHNMEMRVIPGPDMGPADSPCLAYSENVSDEAAECQMLIEKLALIAWYSTKWIAFKSLRLMKNAYTEIVDNEDIGAKMKDIIDRTRDWIIDKADQMIKQSQDELPNSAPATPPTVFSDSL